MGWDRTREWRAIRHAMRTLESKAILIINLPLKPSYIGSQRNLLSNTGVGIPIEYPAPPLIDSYHSGGGYDCQSKAAQSSLI